MGGLKDLVYKPNPEFVALYNELYADYKMLYTYFGRGKNDVMKRLKALRRKAKSATTTAGGSHARTTES